MATFSFSFKSLLLLSALAFLVSLGRSLPVLCESSKQLQLPLPADLEGALGPGGGSLPSSVPDVLALLSPTPPPREPQLEAVFNDALGNFTVPLPAGGPQGGDRAAALQQAVLEAAGAISAAVASGGGDVERFRGEVERAVDNFAQRIAEAFGGGAEDVERIRGLLRDALGLGDGNECFPAAATVELEDGSRRRMDHLRIGDRVHVGGGEFSEVFLFTHRDPGHKGMFVEIQTERAGEEGPLLRVTKGHFLYRDSQMVEADKIRVGDRLEDGGLECGSKGSLLVVKSVRLVHDEGLYNPQTRHGDIVVNGVRATTFTRAVHPTLAHALLKPFEFLFRVGALNERTAGKAFMCGQNLPSMGPKGWQCI